MKSRESKPFNLGDYGKRLWTRQKAQEVRHDLEKLLGSSPAGTVVEIDCRSVEVFDVSFAAEFFCKCLLRLPKEFPDRYVVISGLSEYTRANLDATLKDLDLMALEKMDSKLELIGKFVSSDRETIRTLHVKRKPISAAELAKVLNIKVTAANERLVKLAKRSVIRRQHAETGRPQRVYVPVA